MTRKRWKHTTCKQVGGNDGYQYEVATKDGRKRVNGLTRNETPYYREMFEKEEEHRLLNLRLNHDTTNAKCTEKQFISGWRTC